MKYYLELNDEQFEEYDIPQNAIVNMVFDENFDFQDYSFDFY